MNYGICVAVVGAAWAGAALAVPAVSNVRMVQSAVGGVVSVNYDLSDGPAVVTFDVKTNGVSIGGQHLARAMGDVNRVVSGPSGSFTFYPCERSQDGLSACIGMEDAVAEVTAWPLSSPPDYMVVDLSLTNSATVCPVSYYPCAEQVPGGVGHPAYKTSRLLMRKIPAAGVQWRMGSPQGEVGRKLNDENPKRETPHYVTLTSDYYMGVYEVTQGQYGLFAHDCTQPGVSDSQGQPDSAMRPLDNVSYAVFRGAWDKVWPTNGHDVPDYCPIAKLRLRSGLQFDLPTDAQWEFACRAGTGTALYSGTELDPHDYNTSPEWGGGISDNLDELGWYEQNARGRTQIVGKKRPNAFGLYDMLGNVAEVCLDVAAVSDGTESGWPYAVSVTDPGDKPAGSIGSSRIVRGGSYQESCQFCRSAVRMSCTYNEASVRRGFRLMCPALVPD